VSPCCGEFIGQSAMVKVLRPFRVQLGLFNLGVPSESCLLR
jgi:hypothetical protein